MERVYQLTVSALADVDARAPNAIGPLRSSRSATSPKQRRLEMMRVDFVANASHELRTPLASLLGFIETLQGPARDDAAARERFLEHHAAAGAAHGAADRRPAVAVADRDDASTAGRETPVDLAAVARQMTDTLRPLAEERGVALELHAPHGPLVVPATATTCCAWPRT